ncbi:MAG: FecR domain-containing protein [Chitinophagaceae bacterium]
MEKEYFIELLHKYLEKESTIEEDRVLISYYNLFQSEPDVNTLLSDENKEWLKNQIYAGIQENIISKEKRRSKIRSVKSWTTRIAAAASILIAIAVSVFYFTDQRSSPLKPVITKTEEKKQNHLFYLPDGSLVILSYGSKLQTAQTFNHSNTRDVYLEGEAFFDIHHDASKPFIVHTGKMSTTVLGTAFNVKAFDNDQRVTVTVSRGKVKISDSDKTLDLLTPNQQIIYDKKKGDAVKNPVHAADYLQWKDEEDLFLDNVTFREAAELLEARFSISISFQNKSLEKTRFTTVLLKKETLEQVIKSFCEFNRAVYEYKEHNTTLIISNKTTL